MKARLDDRLGVAAVTYLLFGVTLGPGLALEAPKPSAHNAADAPYPAPGGRSHCW